MIGHLRVIVV